MAMPLDSAEHKRKLVAYLYFSQLLSSDFGNKHMLLNVWPSLKSSTWALQSLKLARIFLRSCWSSSLRLCLICWYYTIVWNNFFKCPVPQKWMRYVMDDCLLIVYRWAHSSWSVISAATIWRYFERCCTVVHDRLHIGIFMDVNRSVTEFNDEWCLSCDKNRLGRKKVMQWRHELYRCL